MQWGLSEAKGEGREAKRAKLALWERYQGSRVPGYCLTIPSTSNFPKRS